MTRSHRPVWVSSCFYHSKGWSRDLSLLPEPQPLYAWRHSATQSLMIKVASSRSRKSTLNSLMSLQQEKLKFALSQALCWPWRWRITGIRLADWQVCLRFLRYELKALSSAAQRYLITGSFKQCVSVKDRGGLCVVAFLRQWYGGEKSFFI